MATPIGTLGTVPTLTIGGRVITDLTNLVRLYGGTSGSPTACSPRKSDGTAGYQVPGGKTFNVIAIKIYYSAASEATGSIQFGYADNDLGYSTNGSATNPVFLAGATPGSGLYLLQTGSGASILNQGFDLDMSIPTGKFLYFNNLGSTDNSFVVYGYEV